METRTNGPDHADGQRKEVHELAVRCREMELELEQLKRRLLQIQAQVEAELKRRNLGV